MRNTPLLSTLKSVSRSFYLSIRVLPVGMRESVAIAYLLARTADTIADSENIDRETRLYCLHQFRSFILISPDSHEIREMIETLIPFVSDADEQKLLELCESILDLYHKLPAKTFSAVQKVVVTLTDGMVMDLSTFIDDDNIIALATNEELEKYTYLVAGCVGEFWTTLSLKHVRAVKHWNQAHYELLGIEFGKALQLTNIIRDISKDAKLGRCYIPAEILAENHLTTELLLDKNNDHLLQPAVRELTNQALEYFDSAEQYLIAIPRRAIRLRLAAFWPILIGIKTLGLISKKRNFLDPDINTKVSRAWVYKMLALSTISILSNSLTTHWIKKTRQSVIIK